MAKRATRAALERMAQLVHSAVSLGLEASYDGSYRCKDWQFDVQRVQRLNDLSYQASLLRKEHMPQTGRAK